MDFKIPGAAPLSVVTIEKRAAQNRTGVVDQNIDDATAPREFGGRFRTRQIGFVDCGVHRITGRKLLTRRFQI